jgi:hypothetical protein
MHTFEGIFRRQKKVYILPQHSNHVIQSLFHNNKKNQTENPSQNKKNIRFSFCMHTTFLFIKDIESFQHILHSISPFILVKQMVMSVCSDASL